MLHHTYWQTPQHVVVVTHQLVLHHRTRLQTLTHARVQRTEVVSQSRHHHQDLHHVPHPNIAHSRTQNQITTNKSSRSQEHLDCYSVVAHGGLAPLVVGVVEAKVAAMAAGVTVGSSKQVSEGVAVSSNQIQGFMEAAIIATVSTLITASGGMAKEKFKQQEGHLKEEVQKGASSD